MSERRAVVTGLGIVSPVGIGAEASWDSLVGGRSGIDTISLFDASQLDVDVAGEVKGFDATQYMDAKDARRHDRSTHLAVAATGEALRDAGEEPSLGSTRRTIATTKVIFSTRVEQTKVKQKGKRSSPLRLSTNHRR